MMNDKANISFIYTHTERHSRHDHLKFIIWTAVF